MTNKHFQAKVYEQWHTDWKTLTFTEQFIYHLRDAGRVKPIQFRKAGRFCDGGIEYDVVEVDMPDDDSPKPFVNKSQLALIGEAVVQTMHSKDASRSQKASVLSLLIGKVPDSLANKATGAGRTLLNTARNKDPVKKGY